MNHSDSPTRPEAEIHTSSLGPLQRVGPTAGPISQGGSCIQDDGPVNIGRKRNIIHTDGETVCGKRICLEQARCQCVPRSSRSFNNSAAAAVPGTSWMHGRSPNALLNLENMVVEMNNKSGGYVNGALSSDCSQDSHVGDHGNEFGRLSTLIQDNASDLSESHDSDSDMEMIEPQQGNQNVGHDPDEGTLSDGQMFIRWHNRHVAKAIVDNAINKTIEEMGLGPSPPAGVETHQRRVEDQGVSEAIRQWGLRRQSPYYASHLSPIINRLTEVSENLFSRALYRPVVSQNVATEPSPPLSSSSSSSSSAIVDLNPVPSSSTRLITSLCAPSSEQNMVDTNACSSSVINESQDVSVRSVDTDVTSLGQSSNTCGDSAVDAVDALNRNEILEQAMTAALSHSGLSCVYQQQSQNS